MGKKTIDTRLKSLLNADFEREGGDIGQPYLENRIFTNRTIKMSRIKAVGFDMDYTLAEYKQDALDQLTMKLALNLLVDRNGYSEEILKIPYKPGFTIRGLVIDTLTGNVLKMDKFRYVSLAYHGLRPLDSDRRAAMYNATRIDFHSGRYRSVDTLFELLETYLFAAIIDHVDQAEGPRDDYTELYRDIRNAIDTCHSDGSLKKQIMSDPDHYIKSDPMLIPALHKFREAGKRLFVVTNSEPDYTDFMLTYLFRNASPFFKGWRHCFDLVGSAARKPTFFNEGQPLEIIEDGDNLFFSGGNLDFLEERLRIKGDQVLYVGDHIYGDILKSKHSTHWRTCIIVPELEFQVRAEEEAKPFLMELLANETRRKQLTMELTWRRGQVYDLHQFKESEADELERNHLERIDERIEELDRQLEHHNRELSDLLFQSRDLRRRISNTFNSYWGRLFKTGGQLSNFAEQIRDYACIYTSAVSNFNFYNGQVYLESMVSPMPHEKNLYPVGDVNFDASLDGGRHPNELPLAEAVDLDPSSEEGIEEVEDRQEDLSTEESITSPAPG
ncbi:HAD-IG family 5'-nucleotidase [Sulfidibacter corallicola]|uniref:HAD-IG family 5'-nucleotidase n=1 Tax=Sulfidibacter corallicola TaxID=2818388 RepID=A0A8A4TY13_SULCO|nr:HAD-IG family 5'-nucleotidase [Sulfidibacter corallicola]QTD54121.1 HAD-IG family 5'-nucleotidase [Sulfidibacter corallicola]